MVSSVVSFAVSSVALCLGRPRPDVDGLRDGDLRSVGDAGVVKGGDELGRGVSAVGTDLLRNGRTGVDALANRGGKLESEESPAKKG